MKSIVFIIPFFGKWPIWFDAHLLSLKANPTIHWLFYTDCKIPNDPPPNCKFVKSTLQDMEVLFSSKIGVSITIDEPYKLCDLKPSYGYVFQDDIKDFDFWGFTDVDIIWGAIRKEMTPEVLKSFDIISSRKGLISGHFNLFKNNDSINKLYRKNDWYKKSYTDQKMKRFCEGTFSEIIKEALKENKIRVKWDRILSNQERGIDSHQEYYLDKWLWMEGKMLELKNGKPVHEVMYLHFINWKRTMKYCKINYPEHPSEFYISYTGVHYKPHWKITKIANGFKNLFDGYWMHETIRKKKHRIRSLTKRVIRKVQSKI
ncbi:DUF6625 family protein [Rasiella sp. SM2506]|uniref:DUF6625 family protein n=1 Tax=Rasiella sp. SM2506 TaxID=3423914 RepID=UPI003D78E078